MTMNEPAGTLSDALEDEHRAIDAGLDHFRAGLDAGELRAPALSSAAAALRQHIYLEEEVLFPPLTVGGLVAPVSVMLREHADIWMALERIEHATANDDVSAAWSGLATLSPLLADHNFKEERIVYPAADEALNGAAADRLRDELAHRTMPAGWTCRALGRR